MSHLPRRSTPFPTGALKALIGSPTAREFGDLAVTGFGNLMGSFFANPYAEKLTGRSLEDEISETFADQIPGDPEGALTSRVHQGKGSQYLAALMEQAALHPDIAGAVGGAAGGLAKGLGKRMIHRLGDKTWDRLLKIPYKHPPEVSDAMGFPADMAKKVEGMRKSADKLPWPSDEYSAAMSDIYEMERQILRDEWRGRIPYYMSDLPLEERILGIMNSPVHLDDIGRIAPLFMGKDKPQE